MSVIWSSVMPAREGRYLRHREGFGTSVVEVVRARRIWPWNTPEDALTVGSWSHGRLSSAEWPPLPGLWADVPAPPEAAR